VDRKNRGSPIIYYSCSCNIQLVREPTRFHGEDRSPIIDLIIANTEGAVSSHRCKRHWATTDCLHWRLKWKTIKPKMFWNMVWSKTSYKPGIPELSKEIRELTRNDQETASALASFISSVFTVDAQQQTWPVRRQNPRNDWRHWCEP
jgi:hypothetical protein